MPGNLDFPRFMAAVGLRSLAENCSDGWITVDRLDGDDTFCRLQLDQAIPFVWAGWLVPTYKPNGQLSHLSWCGPSAAADRLGLTFAHNPCVRAFQSGLMSPR